MVCFGDGLGSVFLGRQKEKSSASFIALPPHRPYGSSSLLAFSIRSDLLQTAPSVNWVAASLEVGRI